MLFGDGCTAKDWRQDKETVLWPGLDKEQKFRYSLSPIIGFSLALGRILGQAFRRRFKMAVQQNKKSRSRKGMRRSHDRVAKPAVIYCSCGEPTTPHSVCPNCGSYRNRQVIARPEAE